MDLKPTHKQLAGPKQDSESWGQRDSCTSEPCVQGNRQGAYLYPKLCSRINILNLSPGHVSIFTAKFPLVICLQRLRWICHEDPAGQAFQTAYSSWEKWFIQCHSLENDTHALATAAEIQLCTPSCCCLCRAHPQACTQPLCLPRNKEKSRRLGNATIQHYIRAILLLGSPQSTAALWVLLKANLWSILLHHLVHQR